MTSTSDLLSLPAKRAVPPALLSLLLSLAAWLPGVLVLAMDGPTWAAVLAQGSCAFYLSRRFGLPSWWQVINLLFFPTAWLVSGSDVDPLWYLAGFITLAATSLGSLRTRVPLYLSSRQAIEEVTQRLPERSGIKVADLGCGLGGMLDGLARQRADIELHGVEMAPFNWLVCRTRLGSRAHIRLGSLWQEDLSGYDVVYAYLSPAPMARLWEKVRREMRPGSLFISNSFAVPGCPPDETVELHDLNDSRLLIWRL